MYVYLISIFKLDMLYLAQTMSACYNGKWMLFQVNRDCDWQASDQALLTKALEFFMIIDNKDVEFVRKIRSAKDVKELSERMAYL